MPDPKTDTAPKRKYKPRKSKRALAAAVVYRPEMCDRAALACEMGLTDHEVAELFGVHDRTINRWKVDHPEFAEALRSGKSHADERVVRSLYHRAIGYSFEAEEIYVRAKPTKVVKGPKGKRLVIGGGTEIIRVKTTKHVPPDPTSMIFWLKNRQRELWRDVHKHEVGAPGAFDHMSPDELRASILEDMKVLNLLPEPEQIAPQAQGVVPVSRGTKGDNGGNGSSRH